MSLKSDQERNNTQTKLTRLLKRHQALSTQSGGDESLRELTLESIKHTMNQLQEEISLYDAHHGAKSEPART